MKILALDLGTKTGWAEGIDGQLVDCGTVVLAKPKDITATRKERMDRRLDPRIPALWRHLLRSHEVCPINWLVWEDVQFSSTTMQTQLWSSFRTAVWVFAYHCGVQTECLGVQKLKQFGAGHGGATKEMMAKALLRGSDPRFFLDASTPNVQFSGKILDDNAVDAVHLLHWAMKTFRNNSK